MLVKNAVEYNADEDGGDADDNDENYGADDENVDNGEDVIDDNVDDSVTSRGTQSYEYPAPALFCRADSETFARQFSTLWSHRLTLKTTDTQPIEIQMNLNLSLIWSIWWNKPRSHQTKVSKSPLVNSFPIFSDTPHPIRYKVDCFKILHKLKRICDIIHSIC